MRLVSKQDKQHVPVIKDCVKKKPDTQKTLGMVESTHSWKNLSLAIKSDTYDPYKFVSQSYIVVTRK
jgi:hypothetical protein